MRAGRRLWMLSGFSAGLLLANLLTNPHFLASTWRHLSALSMSQAATITMTPYELVSRVFDRQPKENHK